MTLYRCTFGPAWHLDADAGNVLDAAHEAGLVAWRQAQAGDGACWQGFVAGRVWLRVQPVGVGNGYPALTMAGWLALFEKHRKAHAWPVNGHG